MFRDSFIFMKLCMASFMKIKFSQIFSDYSAVPLSYPLTSYGLFEMLFFLPALLTYSEN